MSETTTVVPQANRIETVVAVLDAVAAGCDTAASIGAGIGLHQRQGGYYAHAGQTLGFLTVDTTLVPHEWSLTDAGADLVELDASGRAAELTAALLALPELEYFAEGTGSTAAESVEELIADDGYAETTAERRTATYAAWAEFATKPGADQVSALETVMGQARRYAPAAAEARAAEKRAQSREALAYGETCDRCFMTKSLTGECSTCD